MEGALGVYILPSITVAHCCLPPIPPLGGAPAEALFGYDVVLMSKKACFWTGCAQLCHLCGLLPLFLISPSKPKTHSSMHHTETADILGGVLVCNESCATLLLLWREQGAHIA